MFTDQLPIHWPSYHKTECTWSELGRAVDSEDTVSSDWNQDSKKVLQTVPLMIYTLWYIMLRSYQFSHVVFYIARNNALYPCCVRSGPFVHCILAFFFCSWTCNMEAVSTHVLSNLLIIFCSDLILGVFIKRCQVNLDLLYIVLVKYKPSFSDFSGL